jgi:hypothetical protein
MSQLFAPLLDNTLYCICCDSYIIYTPTIGFSIIDSGLNTSTFTFPITMYQLPSCILRALAKLGLAYYFTSDAPNQVHI